ncbi:MAG: hypothetical protein AAGI15_12930 [Pseudomonadota bacterium]
MSKLSLRALDNALDDGWETLQRADTRRRWIRRVMLGLGLAIAVLTPLLNLPELQEEAEPTPTTFNTTMHSQSTGGPGGDDIPYLVPYPVFTRPPEPPGPGGAPGPVTARVDQRLNVVAELNIRSAPPSKIWHRSAFERVGDEFWALPDASFKLQLARSPAPCTVDRCEASLAAVFFDGRGGENTTTVNINGVRLTTQPAQESCETVNDTLPYLLCALDRNSTGTTEDLCLWLRRAPSSEQAPERLALELRWEKRPHSSGALTTAVCRTP